ncbi:hypothetical protein ACXZ1K_06200 [Pedobacter sp. PWIIR3]
MKVIAVFFLSLCFFLTNGYNSVYADLQNGLDNNVSLNTIIPNQHLSPEIANHKSILIKHNRFGEKKEDFLTVEDDDEDLVLARKYVLLTNYFITIAYVSLFLLFCRHLKNHLSIGRHLIHTSSSKYILQRSLRI